MEMLPIYLIFQQFLNTNLKSDCDDGKENSVFVSIAAVCLKDCCLTSCQHPTAIVKVDAGIGIDT